VDEAQLDKLRGIVGPAHVAIGADLGPFVVDGRPPGAAVFPGSVDEVRGVVEVAAGAGIPIVPWGGGTAAHVGAPLTSARPGIVVAVRRLDRIVEHEPGDLTVTAEAGVTLAALQEALRRRGQWLSLDPPAPERATLGGIVAADASGPRRQLYGTMRDLLIGITVVTAEGAVVRGGGKVVKNVAGYDGPKLFIGSWGTLGLVVEVTLKLRPLPAAERLMAAAFERIKDAGVAVRALMASDVIPNAIELFDAEAARPLGLAGGAALVVGFDGFPDQVDWQCEELERLLRPLGGQQVRTLSAETWPRLATAASEAHRWPAAVMRLVILPAMVSETMEQGAGVARHHGLAAAWSAHAGVGVLTAALFSPSEAPDVTPITAVLGAWRALARGAAGHARLEWAPLAVKRAVPVWDEPGAAGKIMQRIKAQLDPHGILNPGRFVAGI
jgi:glycolate oxidase FAD binding subunit